MTHEDFILNISILFMSIGVKRSVIYLVHLPNITTTYLYLLVFVLMTSIWLMTIDNEVFMVSSEVHRHVREQHLTRSVKTIEMSHRVSAHRKLCERQTHLIQYSAGLMKAVMAHVSLLWMSHSGFFCMCYFLFTVSLHKAACRELCAQIIQTSSRWWHDIICGNISASLRLSPDVSHMRSVYHPVPVTAR